MQHYVTSDASAGLHTNISLGGDQAQILSNPAEPLETNDTNWSAPLKPAHLELHNKDLLGKFTSSNLHSGKLCKLQRKHTWTSPRDESTRMLEMPLCCLSQLVSEFDPTRPDLLMPWTIPCVGCTRQRDASLHGQSQLVWVHLVGCSWF